MDMVGELSSRCVRIAGVRHIEVVFQMGAPRVIRLFTYRSERRPSRCQQTSRYLHVP